MFITEEEVDKDLNIDNSSIFTLEKDLLEHPRREAKYSTLAAQAIKNVELKELELEILVASLMETLDSLAKAKGQTVPQSARGDIKKQIMPLLPEYVAKRRELIDANEISNILKGQAKAMVSRNFKLTDLLEIKKRELYGNNVVREDRFYDPMEERRGN
jgi:hypothetical protein